MYTAKSYSRELVGSYLHAGNKEWSTRKRCRDGFLQKKKKKKKQLKKSLKYFSRHYIWHHVYCSVLVPEDTHTTVHTSLWPLFRLEGIMLQIFIIILFWISSKIVSLCSLLCSKSTDYSHYSQLYRRVFTTFSLLQSKTSKMFYSLCVLLSETVTV